MSMKVERSSLDQVKERFNINKKKKLEKTKDYELESRLREAKEEEDRYKEHKKEKKKDRKRKHEDPVEELDDEAGSSDMAAIMGFAGFGGAKRNT